MRILVTRPEPGASATAARLSGLGHEAVCMPLSQTSALHVPSISLDGVVAVVVTSANAVRHTPGTLLETLIGLPWLAVGSTTARVVADKGVKDITDVDGDANALALATVERFGAGARILYLCGRVRVPDFEQMLRASGLTVEIAESYDISEISYDDADVVRLMGQGRVDAALVYSAKSADSLVRLIARKAAQPLYNARLVAISHRAAAPLLAAGYAAQVSASPNEAGMLSLLGND